MEIYQTGGIRVVNENGVAETGNLFVEGKANINRDLEVQGNIVLNPGSAIIYTSARRNRQLSSEEVIDELEVLKDENQVLKDKMRILEAEFEEMKAILKGNAME